MLIRVLLIVLATTGAAFSQGYGKWIIQTEQDELTDGFNVYTKTESKDKVSCGWGSWLSFPAELLVRCQENKTAVYLKTVNCRLTSGDVKYRVDKLSARTKRFTESTDDRALGLWSGGQSIPFLKQLIDHDKLVMRITPYRESSETITFSLKGFSSKIVNVRRACHW